ncbi:MAG: hypothetical protein LPK00_02335 [Bacillaceae bacterium]|nr:hypothetical protein [Bacillaceae bacterium]
MTKEHNKGSRNQNGPVGGYTEIYRTLFGDAGDNSKGNKRNKDQKDKTEL